MKFAVVVPTLDAGRQWGEWLDALAYQSVTPERVVVVDSQSRDGTAAAARARGHFVVEVARSGFDHGGTRQDALAHVPDACEVVVYLTQDAILAGAHALQNIVEAFEDGQVGVAYGRQLPRFTAGPIEAHARLFNYPAENEVRGFEDRERLGIKAAFCSDSFAAYRRSALEEIGGFPRRTIMAEDMITAARMLQAGWKVSYVAYAAVYHSHGYSVGEEFSRYFDMGVMHAAEPWLLEAFGKPVGEGVRFVRSELGFLARRSPAHIPLALVKAAAKLLGYKLGKLERYMAAPLKRQISMNRGYWQ